MYLMNWHLNKLNVEWICHQFIGNPMKDRFIRRIVTCDEKWVYYCNPDASKQWLGPRQPGILKVWFTGSLFQTCVQPMLSRRYPALVNQNIVLLWQDNARPHTAWTTMIKIQELGGIELLAHPTYGPDLAPSDYHLFRSTVHFLCGKNFENIEAVEVGLTEFFTSKVHGCGSDGRMRACHATGPGSIPGRDKFPGWDFFRGFSSPVRQMSGSFRPTRSPNIIWPSLSSSITIHYGRQRPEMLTRPGA